MRAAIYGRTSTDNRGQDPEVQLRQLREWCQQAGHEVVGEYVDQDSGLKGVNGRKQFARLFEDAHRRKFGLLVFWALDRFSREGMVPTIKYLEQLASYGVNFHSYTEPHLSTDNEMLRDILLAVLSSMARQESRRHSERVLAGMARAKAQGTKSGKAIGRPALDPQTRAAIRAAYQADGASLRSVARMFHVGPETVRRICA